MSPGEVFDPSAALDPTRFVGQTGAARLLEAAQHFPGGATMLVFALFWAPVGPGIPAGVLLARHIPLNPGVTFGLYALSDVLGGLICAPLFAVLKRHGRKVKAVHWLGRHALVLALLGYGVGRLSHTLVRDRAGTQFGLLVVATVAHQAWTLPWELGGIAGLPYQLQRLLLAALFTAPLGSLVLGLIRRASGQPLFGHAATPAGPSV